MNDIEVILKALTREREDLHQQLMQVDRIIKRVKCGTYSDDVPEAPKQLQANVAPVKPKPLAPGTDLKIQVLRIFDLIGVATTLKQIHTEYKAISGHNYNLRESVRSLHQATLLKIIKDKKATRGFMWVKSEWIEDGQLLDKYKPEGFDLLHPSENIYYE